MNQALLVINAGSSSIKFALFSGANATALERAYHGKIEGIGTAPHLVTFASSGAQLVDEGFAGNTEFSHAAALARLFAWLANHAAEYRLLAVGHRVVHGGERYAGPVLIDAAILAGLEALVPLAPLHQPHNLAAIRAIHNLAPQLPQVACFDTAFHRTQPALAQAFALPRAITDAGIKRYGFHGLSYEYIADVLPDYLGDQADGRVVVAHLGNGASLCAMKKRNSVATTMGFTALEGLMMGTRSGTVDPGVLLYLMQQQGMSAQEVTDLLYHRSGLLGVSGISSDMRTLLASNDPRAREAIELFSYRIGRELGSLAAALGGLDALVFTAGIGEHAAPVRAAVCRATAWLGLELDAHANEHGAARISLACSRVSAWVIPTDEEQVIAIHTRAVVNAN